MTVPPCAVPSERSSNGPLALEYATKQATGYLPFKKAKDFCCDLVLLDIAMPILNGVETASALRAALPQTKIVGFSALGYEPGPELVASKKFDVVLSKRDGLVKLVDVVKSLMPKPH